MAVRKADAVWRGDLKSGEGTITAESGAFRDASYTYASRFEEGKGTNPDELVGAALASCYSMFLASLLAQDDHAPERVSTEARVHLSTEGGPHIARIELITEGEVPGIDEATFRDFADRAKAGCPVSKALQATEIRLEAKLA